MRTKAILLSALLAGLTAFGGGRSAAQEPGKSSDEALDSLIEKLGEPAQEDRPSAERPQERPRPKSQDQTRPDGPEKPRPGEVSDGDKELDELLEKLGTPKDEPSAPGRPGARPPTGESGEPGGSGQPDRPQDRKAKGPDLQDRDKELDERLEELTGRRRKRNRQEQEDGSGPLGELIKQMREVEQRLGKPETGEETQSRQKQIVKRIETLIQQVKQSGSQGQMAMRTVRQAGQKPGDKPGQTPGANPGGAPPMKPAKPSERHALAGGKEIWGHLPAELRQEMENVFKEDALPAKEDLIKRYYLSIARQKVRRGE